MSDSPAFIPDNGATVQGGVAVPISSLFTFVAGDPSSYNYVFFEVYLSDEEDTADGSVTFQGAPLLQEASGDYQQFVFVNDSANDFVEAGQYSTATVTVNPAPGETIATIAYTTGFDEPDPGVPGGIYNQQIMNYLTVDVNASLFVTPGANAESVILSEDASGNITGSNAANDIVFTDTNEAARPTATIGTPQISAVGPNDLALPLSASDLAAIEQFFTIQAGEVNANNGVIDWSYTPAGTALEFLGLDETITADFPVLIEDQFGNTATSSVSLTFAAPEPTKAIADASSYGTIIAKAADLLFQSALVFSNNWVAGSETFRENLNQVNEIVEGLFNVAEIEYQYVQDVQAAGNDPTKLYEAELTACVDLTNLAVKTLLGKALQEVLVPVGTAIATYGAIAGATGDSSANAVADALLSKLDSTTVFSTALSVGLVALASAVSYDYVYDNYFAPVVKQYATTAFGKIQPPPLQSGSGTTALSTDTQDESDEGYLVNSTVYQSANGASASGDASATTDVFGSANIINGSGEIVLVGGTDESTGLIFNGTLTAPSGSDVLTPLTTIIEDMEDGSTTGDNELLIESFNLGTYANVLVDDPIGETLANEAPGPALFSTGSEVLNLVEITTAALQGLGVGFNTAWDTTFQEFANLIDNGNGQTLDLTNVLTTTSVVTQAILHLPSPLTVSPQIESALGTLVAAVNEIDAAALASDQKGQALISTISAVSRLVQSSLFSDIRASVTSGASLAAVVTAFNGTSLAAAEALAYTQLPIAAVAVTETVAAGATLTVADASSGILAQDVTNTGTILVASIFGPNGAGQVGQVIAGLYGELTLAADGSFTYVADNTGSLQPGQTVDDGFVFTISDGTNTSPPAQLDIDVIDTAPCFLKGTRLLTPAGEVAVEDLHPGRDIVTISGAVRRVAWVGHTDIDSASQTCPGSIFPFRVTAHAFGPGRPVRDLWLSPDHAVFIEEVLIPIRYLSNGITIRQEKRRHISYWHVELERHDVILASGLPCESFLDTGNRRLLADDTGTQVYLAYDFHQRVWEANGYAPLRVAGAEVEAVKATLWNRAQELRNKAKSNRARVSRVQAA